MHVRTLPTRVHVLTSRASDLYIGDAANHRLRILTTLAIPHTFARFDRPNIIGGLAAAGECDCFNTPDLRLSLICSHVFFGEAWNRCNFGRHLFRYG
jgi:hypothetical protein